MDQCVVISDESFDREILEDGHIYFLNTQKLGKAGNLSRHSDTRQYTIWETIENTAREKADRLYFIIDEAHRGMQGRQAGTATTIMQRFIKGSSEQNLLPIPVVIGMSATAERFNSLVGQATNSTLHKVIISPAQVRQSGLLKDRIVITYPEDPIKHGDMAVLQAATDEWQDKCKHWYQYTYEQHYTNVNPVFVIQVCAGSGTKVSDTDLDDVIAKIEERMGDSFKENEVVHTFGSTGTLSIHGLTVPHIEPSEIAEDRRIRVVLFKENLSTGWDCPRAETMMSFRRAEDATYIAQLLGRMVRTPLQCHVLVDDSLNDVRLFLPYFNQDTVQKVIDELQATEGGEIPTVVDGESLEEQNYDTWSVHNQRKKTQKLTVGQLSIFDYPNGFQEEPAVAPSTAVGDMPNSGVVAVNQGRVDSELPAEGQTKKIRATDKLLSSTKDKVAGFINCTYLADDAEFDTSENIADNKKEFYEISLIENYRPFIFLDDAEKRTEYYSESDRNKLSGFLFRINLNDKYFWVYQHIYSVSRIDRSKNVIALFVGDTYDEIDSDIVQIDSRADVIIFSSSVVTAKMDLMQRFFGFEQYIRAGAQKTIEIIRDLDIVDSLEKFVAFENKSKLTNAKKLLKAKNSPVLQMKKNDLLENLKKHSRYKTMFKFEEDHIVISSQKEAAAFIKMLNDDIVRSELTGKEYDSSSKMLLGPVGASH